MPRCTVSARGAAIVAALLAFCAESRADEPAAEPMSVDAVIVLAVDASSSIGPEEAGRQRRGHAEALRSREVNAAIAVGPAGCIAITYIEWAGVGTLRTVLPWTKLCDGEGTAAAAEAILLHGDDGRERRGRGRTSLSFAVEAGSLLLDRFPGEAMRKVIDVSSNGTNNDGPPVAESRDRAVRKGLVVNGIVLSATEPGVTDDLPGYFRQTVIGGPASFVVVPDGPDDYATALRRKLVLEISGRLPEAGTVRTAFADLHASAGEEPWPN